jgi:TP901 family phage tail tape measure protein
MLELAKGGLTTAQIKAGVLQQTLTLAAAGGLELGAAATYMANTMNAFGLQAADAARIAAALAGGANASTASVESLGMALAQSSAQAKLSGMNLNETVAALAALDAAGVKGSDAGTSLKVMLQRLVPSTAAAADEMQRLGIHFQDSKGNMVSMSNVARQLHTALDGQSEAAKMAALNTMFGSDASRAAAIMADVGAQGIDKMTRATLDLSAAENLAKTNTEGAAGSWEQLMGSLNTLAILVGKIIAPAFITLTGAMTRWANKFSHLSPRTQKITVLVAALAAAIGPLLIVVGTAITAFGAIAAAVGAVSLPVIGVVAAIVALGVGLVIAYKRSERFRAVIHKGVIPAAKMLWRIMTVTPLGIIIRLVIRFTQSLLRGGAALRAVKMYVQLVWTILRNSPIGIVIRLVAKLVGTLVRLAGGWGAVGSAIRAALSWVEGMVNRIISAVTKLGSKLTDAAGKIKGIATSGGNFNPLNWMAKGGVVTRPQIVGIGEAGPEAVVPLGTGARATRDRQRVMAQAGLTGSGGGGGIVVHQYFRGEPDMFAASRAVRASFRGRFA